MADAFAATAFPLRFAPFPPMSFRALGLNAVPPLETVRTTVVRYRVALYFVVVLHRCVGSLRACSRSPAGVAVLARGAAVRVPPRLPAGGVPFPPVLAYA